MVGNGNGMRKTLELERAAKIQGTVGNQSCWYNAQHRVRQDEAECRWDSRHTGLRLLQTMLTRETGFILNILGNN